jgi:hypothetical protein
LIIFLIIALRVPLSGQWCAGKCPEGSARLTVDGNGDRLGEGEVVGANKGRDEAELVDEPVVIGDALGGLGVDKLDVEVVDVGHGLDGNGAGVALGRSMLAMYSCGILVCDMSESSARAKAVGWIGRLD